jgi:hypothetical protein
MNTVYWGVSSRYRIACICDALALPVLFLLWYRSTLSVPGISATGQAANHPGLVGSTIMMILLARGAIRLEGAIWTHWEYRFDVARAVRFLILIPLIAMGVITILR